MRKHFKNVTEYLKWKSQVTLKELKEVESITVCFDPEWKVKVEEPNNRGIEDER